ncbi:MAG: methylated-DNA--[protein]-cysteine S-methyltransferase [Thermoleophilia bacterium]
MRTSTKLDDRLTGRRELTFASRWGPGRLVLAGGLPLELELPEAARRPLPARGAPDPWVALLERYFAGERVDFPLDVDAHADALGFTAFERAVYRALAGVPYGSAVSYRELAAAAGRPNAYRAVGSAMARNLLPVILPCHRVVKNDGRLGYYGDDPAWKARLLTLEGVSVHGARLAGAEPS